MAIIQTLETRAWVRCAMFAALIGALGLLPPVPVPLLPVPVTAQTLGVMLAGAVLGPTRGAIAVVLFLGVVGLGLPLLAGGRGGLAVFFGPSAGFLFGWIVGAYVVGLLRHAHLWRLVMACLCGGIIAVYAVGIPWMAIVADLSLGQAVFASAFFLPGDLVKAVLAALAARAIQRGYPQAWS